MAIEAATKANALVDGDAPDGAIAVLDAPGRAGRIVRAGRRAATIVRYIGFALTSWIVSALGVIFAVVGLTASAALTVVWIGLPLLSIFFVLLLLLARFERFRMRSLLGIQVYHPYRGMFVISRSWNGALSYLRERQVWRDILYFFVTLPLAVLEIVPFLTWPVSRVHGAVAQSLLCADTDIELRREVRRLHESRTAALQAMYVERQRIERDLHDGAQQQLVSLAMNLGMARERYRGDRDDVAGILGEAHTQSKQILTDLRTLVQGIYPAILTDRGLEAAINAVAGRSAIPIDVRISLSRRLSPELEGAVYFIVMEALANVAKHSQATEASVRIREHRGAIAVAITDNGIGGVVADGDAGTGLRGLRARIEAFDGRLTVESPPGQGTRITVEIPCE